MSSSFPLEDCYESRAFCCPPRRSSAPLYAGAAIAAQATHARRHGTTRVRRCSRCWRARNSPRRSRARRPSSSPSRSPRRCPARTWSSDDASRCRTPRVRRLRGCRSPKRGTTRAARGRERPARINGLLQPGEIQTITIETPYNPKMNSNNWNFAHANGTVKPAKVKLEKLDGAARRRRRLGQGTGGEAGDYCEEQAKTTRKDSRRSSARS